MAANVEGLCGKDRERAGGAAPGGRKRNILYGKVQVVTELSYWLYTLLFASTSHPLSTRTLVYILVLANL